MDRFLRKERVMLDKIFNFLFGRRDSSRSGQAHRLYRPLKPSGPPRGRPPVPLRPTPKDLERLTYGKG
jgi:hypothetical protein